MPKPIPNWGFSKLKEAFTTRWGGKDTTLLSRAGKSLESSRSAGWLGRRAMDIPNAAAWAMAAPINAARGIYNKAPVLTVGAAGLGGLIAMSTTLKPSSVPNQLAPEAMPAMDPNMVVANVNQALSFTDPQVADAALSQIDPTYGKMVQASNQIMAQSAQRAMMMDPRDIAVAQAAANSQPSMA